MTWSFAASIALKSSLILLAAAILAAGARRAAASLRHAIWATALMGVLAMPLLSLVPAFWSLPLLPAPASFGPAASEADVATPVAADPGPAPDRRPAGVGEPGVPSVAVAARAPGRLAASASASSVPPDWIDLVALLWLAGSAVVLLKLGVGLGRLFVVSQRARTVRDTRLRSVAEDLVRRLELRRPVRLLESADFQTPVTWGWWYPVALIPSGSDSWDIERKRIVLLHELTHVRHAHWPMQIAATVACAVHWFNPLVWFAARRLEIERERACDEAVLAQGTKASDYATHLMEIAQTLAGRRASPASCVPMLHGSTLERRLTTILERRAAIRRRGAPRLVVAGLCAVTVVVSVVQPWAVAAPPSAASPIPSDEEIRQILIQRVGDRTEQIGIVVGVIEPGGRRLIAHGSAGEQQARALDGDTVFEIGSITKVFTALLLADMAARGEVSLEDPVADHLPPDVRVPERAGRRITLADLATHTSGLPRLPANLRPDARPDNPYASYSVTDLYTFLSGHELTRDIGSQYEYSNLGVGLLGHALSRRAGVDYETLVRQRITGPLQMRRTSIALSPDMRERLATGHDNRFEPVANWDLPTLAGAGALRSTADDMLDLLAAQMGYTSSALAPAMASMLTLRRPAGLAGEIALGWHVLTVGDREIVRHNGGTGGYRSFVGFDPAARAGVIVLTNVSNPVGVDDIGMHLLDRNTMVLPPGSPVLQPPSEHAEIEVDPGTYDAFVGQYRFAPTVLMTITREGDRLMAQLTGQGAAEIFPEAERGFFYKVVDAQITFQTDEQGRVNGLTLHQNGVDQVAVKLDTDAAPPQEWFGHREAEVDPGVFDDYVGRYEMAPGQVLTVTRQGDQLSAQLTGQPAIEIFPEAERRFFYKVVDAQLTFQTDAQGRVNAVTLHQNGRDLIAQKLDTDAAPPDEWFGHRVATVDPGTFDGYVGRYQLAPGLVITITRQGDRLLAQLTGQPAFDVFPEAEREFFFKVVDAQLTFETDGQGRATAVVLHQNGQSPRAPRID